MTTNLVPTTTTQAQSKYEFERTDIRFIAGNDAATDEDEKVFVARLQFNLDNHSPPHVKRAVRAYVTAVHRNISYYVAQRKDEEKRYKDYMYWTVGLVIAIPIATALLALIPRFFDVMQGINTSEVLLTQIIAVMAGVFGVHRLYSTWMFRRNSAHAFWQASAQLKTLLYSFEQHWAQRVLLGTTFDPLFLKALEEGKAAADEVVAKEQDSFFQALGNLQVDLQDIATKAVEASEGISTRLAEPILKQIAAREQKSAQILGEASKAREELVALLAKRKLIEEMIARLKNRSLTETSTDRRSDLNGQIKNAEARLASIEFDLMDRQAAYKAKWATATNDKALIS
ncbi:MAG: hypothetical protein E6R14_05330 [Thermomicrobiales bacterium]|nr:MAG: hypothetical protein E6R14_05330 [Thermomicrobiales bacterium]